MNPGRSAPPVGAPETAIQAGEIPTPAGPIWCAEAVYPDAYRHGRVTVGSSRAWDGDGLARLAREPRAATVPLEQCVFLDVESTGLGAHAGIHAFLVGLGWMAQDGFHLEQVLMRDPGEEAALLHRVEERLQAGTLLVTFNGKAFDVPLLAARFELGRRAVPVTRLAHCDLLGAARRAWAHRLHSCRLVRLERAWLGFRRHRDLEGSLVPEVYRDYLRRGDGALLDPVLEHNRRDLVSLLLLAAEAARFLGRAERPEATAADRLRAARIRCEAGETAAAEALLGRCLGEEVPEEVRGAAQAFLAAIRKRRGDLAGACELWEALARADPHAIGPFEELAKVAEHRARDPVAALGWVDRRLAAGALDAVSEAALRHRRQRLARKAGGSVGPLPAWTWNC
jgi:hypothetical protein